MKASGFRGIGVPLPTVIDSERNKIKILLRSE